MSAADLGPGQSAAISALAGGPGPDAGSAGERRPWEFLLTAFTRNRQAATSPSFLAISILLS
jgi:hypothetical protein